MSKIRVLLAEDHAVVREGVRQLICQEPDMEVVGEAANGQEAVEMAARLRPDVALMDIAMPVVNGIEATREIKALLPATAVLVLTAYHDDQFVFALLEARAAGYLLKDVRGQQLVDSIRAVHAGESVLHPVVARKVLSRFVPSGPARPEPAKEEALTQRELEVLRLAATGMTNKDIADKLVLSVRTVQAHLNNIFRKLLVGSRTEAVIHALTRGWFTLDELKD